MHDPGAILKQASAFRRAVQRGLAHKPLYIKLKLEWNCNLRCTMCDHWRSHSGGLPTTFYHDLAKELAEMGCKKIHFTGGEPTLRPDLESLIAHVASLGIRPTMTSNAIALTEKRAERLAQAGLARINISLDSPDAQVHDRRRGMDGAFAKTIKGVRAMADRLGAKAVRLNTVVGTDNYQSLDQLPDLAQELGVGHINLIPMDAHATPGIDIRSASQEDTHTTSHGGPIATDVPIMDTDSITRYNREIAPVVQSKARRWRLFRPTDSAYIFGTAPQHVQESAHGLYSHGYYQHRSCLAPFVHALIDHRGRVRPCCKAPSSAALGNLTSASFSKVWYNEAFTRLRNEQYPEELRAACHRCAMFVPHNKKLRQGLFPLAFWRR